MFLKIISILYIPPYQFSLQLHLIFSIQFLHYFKLLINYYFLLPEILVGSLPNSPVSFIGLCYFKITSNAFINIWYLNISTLFYCSITSSWVVKLYFIFRGHLDLCVSGTFPLLFCSFWNWVHLRKGLCTLWKFCLSCFVKLLLPCDFKIVYAEDPQQKAQRL